MTSAIALMTGSMAQRRRGFGLGAVCTFVGSRVPGVTGRTSDSWHMTRGCPIVSEHFTPVHRMILHLVTLEVR